MMQFTKIDINNWTRKEYFDHYFGNTPCTYSMTVKLDISKLKKDGKKLYPTLLYGVTTIINRHEEFRTALDENGQVGVFSEMLPCYTVFHKETETFSSIWTEFTADYTEFLQNYQKDIDAFGERMGMSAKPNPPENTFPVSMIPWTSFEGFNLNLKKGYDYLLPIFTFGKYYEEGGKYYIPLSIQVHHAVCDGFHVCRFLDELQPPAPGGEGWRWCLGEECGARRYRSRAARLPRRQRRILGTEWLPAGGPGVPRPGPRRDLRW